MAEQTESLRELEAMAAYLTLDIVEPDSGVLPDLGCRLLEEGYNSPSLRQLAGEIEPCWSDVEPLFLQVLTDLGLMPMSKRRAVAICIRDVTSRLATGEKDLFGVAIELDALYGMFITENTDFERLGMTSIRRNLELLHDEIWQESWAYHRDHFKTVAQNVTDKLLECTHAILKEH